MTVAPSKSQALLVRACLVRPAFCCCCCHQQKNKAASSTIPSPLSIHLPHVKHPAGQGPPGLPAVLRPGHVAAAGRGAHHDGQGRELCLEGGGRARRAVLCCAVLCCAVHRRVHPYALTNNPPTHLNPGQRHVRPRAQGAAGLGLDELCGAAPRAERDAGVHRGAHGGHRPRRLAGLGEAQCVAWGGVG